MPRRWLSFPDGEQYQKRAADMQHLTEIETHIQAGRELTQTDLRFLYQIDGKIEGFGIQRDPRIDELLDGRDAKQDLSSSLTVDPTRLGPSQVMS